MKKKLTLVVAFVLVFALGVAGTFAYLTSTDTVTNTFTVGNVQIKLDEAAANTDGSLIAGADRVDANRYKLLPGHKYAKDPTVTVLAKSEESYVRMLVTINKQAELDAIFAAINADKSESDKLTTADCFVGVSDAWTLVGITKSEDNTTRTYEFRYNEKVPYSENATTLPALFQSIIVPGEITNDQLKLIDGLEINVVAQAIQADGFDTAADAWAKW